MEMKIKGDRKAFDCTDIVIGICSAPSGSVKVIFDSFKRDLFEHRALGFRG